MELPKLAARRIGRPRTALPAAGWRTPPEGTDYLFSDYDNFRALNPDQPLRRPAAPPPSPEASSSLDDEIAEELYDEKYKTEVEAEKETDMIMEKEMPAPSVMRSAPQKMMKKSRDIQAPMEEMESRIEEALPETSAQALPKTSTQALPEIQAEALSKTAAQGIPEIGTGTDARAEMLDYNRLRLAAADSAYRDRLKKASKR